MFKFIEFLKYILGPKKPIEDYSDQLPHVRTRCGIQVDTKAAMDSSLRQLGNGIKLSPKQIKHLKLIINNNKK